MHSLIGNSRKPDIMFHRNGKIDISAYAAKCLRLSDGDVIDVVQDFGEYLITVRQRASDTIGRHEGVCHRSNARGRHFRAYSKKLCTIMLNMAEAKHCVAFPVGEKRTIVGVGDVLHVVTQNPLMKQ